PCLATIARAEHTARFSRRGLAAPGDKHARFVGLHRDAAGVGQGPLALDADRRPRLAAIVAPEQLAVRADPGARRARAREGYVVDVGVVEAAHDFRPGVAAVGTAEDAVDLDAGPHDARVVGVDEHAGHERLSDRALGRGGDVELLPRPPAVARTIDRGRSRPREQRLRIG